MLKWAYLSLVVLTAVALSPAALAIYAFLKLIETGRTRTFENAALTVVGHVPRAAMTKSTSMEGSHDI